MRGTRGLLACSIGAFAVAFMVELAVLALLRPILDPDPEGEQLYLAWTLIGAPALVLLASSVLWFASFLLSCGGTQTPFFRLGCN